MAITAALPSRFIFGRDFKALVLVAGETTERGL
jgi:hypothetical protein